MKRPKNIFLRIGLPWAVLVGSVFGVIKLNDCIDESYKDYLKYYPKTCGFFFKSTSNKTGEMSWFRYKVGDQVYETRGGRFDSGTFGNLYSIAYDSTDPEDIFVDWSEQWIRQSTDNITIWVGKVDVDTVPNAFGWIKINYSYHIGHNDYEGCRFVKEYLYKRVNIDSVHLQCTLNPNYPRNSYLFWPGEEPLVMTE